MNFETAARLAENHVARISREGDLELLLLHDQTLERDFGWVFFYAAADPKVLLAGNAPFIIDRNDGSVHATGTAYTIERYLESYARVGRTYPFAVPEYVAIIGGWTPGDPPFLKISLTKLVRKYTVKSLSESKRCTDEVLAGQSVTLAFPSIEKAEQFCAEARSLGSLARSEARWS